MLWQILTVTAVVASLWLRWRYKHRRLLKVAQEFPGPATLPFLGNALDFMCNPEKLVVVIRDLMVNYGTYVRFWLGPDLNVVVSDPDELKVLLASSKISYKGPQYKYMGDVLGGGILSGSGPTWRKHRKLATPNYGKQPIKNYGGVFNREVSLLLDKYRAVPHNIQFDIYRYIVQTTSYSVCQTLMGLSKEQTMNLPYIQNLIDETPRLYDIVFDRMTKWYLQIEPIFWMSSYYQEQKQFIRMTRAFAKEVLRCRMEHLKTLTDNFKNHHMKMEEDTQLSVIDRFILSGEFEDEELLKETFTIFTSSQEASAKITSFLLLMMAYHPDCQAKLYNEIKSVIGTEDRDVTDEDLKNMPYLEMAFKEILRLFPIGAILQRTIPEDVQMSKGVLPAGSSLVIPVYHLHRDPRFWENPDAFDPERFSPEKTKNRHPYCYIPFSLGPMDCLGRYFGTKLIKTICVRVLREFEIVSLNQYKDLRVIIAISAVSIDGYYAMLKPRRNGMA
ncbi:hypothetical protein ACJJTC_008318 [Scirpophaga incertulas]